MKTKLKKQSKLEDMSDDELLELQDGFIQLRSHATRGLENITKILHDRLEKRFDS
tara:strand:- start:98 stop:262 length:165 start_codon:yes stop_codon:yes gene_type:complete